MNGTYPLVTFFIVSYNQEKFIAEAIDGAFAQDYPNLEIIISDDCSQDSTWDVIKEKASQYQGPHKLILNRNEPNLGPREHINKVLYNLSHGEIIVMSAGDDISRRDRVSVCVELMEKHSEVMSMSVASKYIDEEGNEILLGDWNLISAGQYSIYTLADYISYDFYLFSGDSRVLRRKVIDAFPPLQYTYAEDIYLFVRSFLLGKVAYLREPLVNYRQHQDSIMGKSRKKKKTKDDIYRFKETGYKQLKADFEFAVKNNYITTAEVPFVEWKIEQIAQWLCPKRKTIWWRMVHRMQRCTNNFFEKILKILQ